MKVYQHDNCQGNSVSNDNSKGRSTYLITVNVSVTNVKEGLPT